MNLVKFRLILLYAILILAPTLASVANAQSSPRTRGPQPPEVGDKATQFLLRDVSGRRVDLRHLTHYGPVTLVFLRGFPKTQSAICKTQFQRFIKESAAFAESQSSVVFVYPGEHRELKERATEFVGRTKMPEDFYLVVDGNSRLTKAYGLEWNSIRETAYPCTVVVDRKGQVRYVKASTHHSGRTTPADVLPQLKEAQFAFLPESAKQR
jgi:peroxiredoxin